MINSIAEDLGMTKADNGPTFLTKLDFCKSVDPDLRLENIWQFFIYRTFPMETFI